MDSLNIKFDKVLAISRPTETKVYIIVGLADTTNVQHHKFDGYTPDDTKNNIERWLNLVCKDVTLPWPAAGGKWKDPAWKY